VQSLARVVVGHCLVGVYFNRLGFLFRTNIAEGEPSYDAQGAEVQFIARKEW